MKIAVTGASGFIGQELIRLFNNTDYEIVALSRSRKDKNFIETNYSVDSLTNAFKNVDVVIHLAAIRGGDSALGYGTFRENEILTENILKAMANCKASKIIYLSSISVYSDIQKLPWCEDQAVTPCNFYGLSKLTCEHLCRLYSKKGIESVIFRCAHVLGYEDKGYMLSKFLKAAAEKNTLCVRGKSIAKREFIYVKDVARAIIWAIDNSKVCGVFNLGIDCAYTNLEVAQVINRVFQNEDNLEYQDDLTEGINSSYMLSEKIRCYGFNIKYDLQSGIKDIRREKFDMP
ncbi:MAG: NAD(P)-dependent oxidoreductase [Lachnospiraceae bacterium]|nr:NAD(P)-dependent oxidoreductase [Lachnospiraceae bacterium]